MASTNPSYKRILLKLGGESISSNDNIIDKCALNFISEEINKAKKLGIEIAIVVGGGNILRGRDLNSLDINKTIGDYMGMLATCINALVLQSTLEKTGCRTTVQTAVPIGTIVKGIDRRAALEDLKDGKIVIFAGGTGNPHFTTDSGAALRAIEISADVLLKATKVNGVYSDDPLKNSKAKIFKSISYSDVLSKNLRIMDSTAISMCMEYKLPVIVFNFNKEDNIKKAVMGKGIGTLIH
jgi:uridylate kinase